MENYSQIIDTLNEELYEAVGEVDRLFSYHTTGYEDLIYFGEVMLWSSEMSERLWDEDKKEYEPFLPFIKRMYNQEIEKLKQFKF